MIEENGETSPWEKRFHRERKARKEAELLLEEKASELFELNSELKKLNQNLESKVLERTKELEHKIYHDSVTGLRNNYALLKDIENSDKYLTSLFLINIDNFQDINNLYGFENGNSILNYFAKILEKFKDRFYIYRNYADEFALLKKYDVLNIEEHYSDLKEIKKEIENSHFPIENSKITLNLDVTIGVSIAQDDLLSSADMAMFYAKNNKISYQVFHSGIDKKSDIEGTLKWKDRIKSALDDDRVVPVFQPIVNRNAEIIKYEVLIRIKSERLSGALIPPSKFIDEADKLKLSSFLTTRVIGKTFKTMENSDKQFSINLSFDDIFDMFIVSYLEKMIKGNPECAQRLVIEVLETHEITNLDLMNNFIKKMRKYGVKIAIDDFGVGHSSFSQVFMIKPDYIKIDGEFVKNIVTDNSSYALVSSVVTFAKAMNIKVVAEYVESKEIFDVLHLIGVDEFQGFYFSPPLKTIN